MVLIKTCYCSLISYAYYPEIMSSWLVEKIDLLFCVQRNAASSTHETEGLVLLCVTIATVLCV